MREILGLVWDIVVSIFSIVLLSLAMFDIWKFSTTHEIFWGIDALICIACAGIGKRK